jgi:hypothetical protein
MKVTITLETAGVEVGREFLVHETTINQVDWNEKVEDMFSSVVESQYV